MRTWVYSIFGLLEYFAFWISCSVTCGICSPTTMIEVFSSVLLNHCFFFLPSGKSARSLLICSLRIVHLWETRGRRPSWSLESKAAWPTSASSLMASALRPSALPWPHFRTTWMRRSNKWTRCTWALVATPRDPQTVGANLPTKWTSTGNESSKENPYELEIPPETPLAPLSALFGLF